jgi:hypothetical protein
VLAEKEKESLRQQEERRAKLAEDYRRAEETHHKEEEARQAAKKALHARKPQQDDDDDDGFPLWKKGAIVAASVFLLWWTGSAALGWFFSPVRMSQPRTPISGKAVLAKSGEPLTGAVVAFHPKEGGEGTRCYVVKGGKYSTALFPGLYVVTVSPDGDGMRATDSEALVEIPAIYKDRKSSPLVVEVSKKDNSFDFQLK